MFFSRKGRQGKGPKIKTCVGKGKGGENGPKEKRGIPFRSQAKLFLGRGERRCWRSEEEKKGKGEGKGGVEIFGRKKGEATSSFFRVEKKRRKDEVIVGASPPWRKEEKRGGRRKNSTRGGKRTVLAHHSQIFDKRKEKGKETCKF